MHHLVVNIQDEDVIDQNVSLAFELRLRARPLSAYQNSEACLSFSANKKKKEIYRGFYSISSRRLVNTDPEEQER